MKPDKIFDGEQMQQQLDRVGKKMIQLRLWVESLTGSAKHTGDWPEGNGAASWTDQKDILIYFPSSL